MAGSTSFGSNFAMAIVMDADELITNLRRAPKRVLEEVDQILQYEAPRIEALMKTTAPWTDQTGNARNGLAARAYHEGDEQGIVLYHQVPYGIWLEISNDGRYAVIIPTLESEAQNVMSRVEGLLGRI